MVVWLSVQPLINKLWKLKRFVWKPFFGYLVIFVFFFARSLSFLDPDFGWHLKMGELISTVGIPATDPFSYSMASFPFVDHEWLTNIVIYQIHRLVGYPGLAIGFTLLFVATIRNCKKLAGEWWLLPVFIAMATLGDPFGVRPQVISWFLVSQLLIWLVFSSKRWFLPVVFLVWANLHGSFPVGLALWAILVIGRTWQEKRIKWSEIGWWGVSFILTCVNPYGIRLWGEVWQQMSDANLRWTIAEWLPYLVNGQMGTLLGVAIGSVLVWRYRKILDRGLVLVWVVFLVQGLGSTRQIPLWAIVNAITLPLVWAKFKAEVDKINGGNKRLVVAERWGSWLAIGLIGAQMIIGFFSILAMSEDRFYPKTAVNYLKDNLPTGNLFSQYGWGGYLIWKYPEKKLFIDGRMPSFRYARPEGQRRWDDLLLPVAPNNLTVESKNAFADYRDFLSGKTKVSDFVYKYQITTIVWSVKTEKISQVESVVKKVFAFVRKDISYDWEKELLTFGFRETYRDNVAIVYQLPTEQIKKVEF